MELVYKISESEQHWVWIDGRYMSGEATRSWLGVSVSLSAQSYLRSAILPNWKVLFLSFITITPKLFHHFLRLIQSALSRL
jgi:hypothetical protein